MYFPEYRPRRLRERESLRRLIRETSLTVDDLIYPVFVLHGKGVRREIKSMPGQYQVSVDELVNEAKALEALGIPGLILFGLPESKDAIASEAYDDDGIVQRAVRAVKKECKDLLVVTDVCLCEYMDHGHCGVEKDGKIDNDLSIELIAKTALSHAEAGADIVAPSDMMDGRVAAIRSSLDETGFGETPVMSYASKYASSFYGPFREAAESTPQFGDRRSYQMDPANSEEALREVTLDLEEGADIVMVKPALPYLDIIYRVKTEFRYPVAAYNVSGEYSALKAAADRDYLDERKTVLETLTSIKRAGADIILTYHAKDAAGWLRS